MNPAERAAGGTRPDGFIRADRELDPAELEDLKARWRQARHGQVLVMEESPGDDAFALRAAAAVLRRRAERPNLVTRIFIRTLEKNAARVERSG